MTKRKEQPENPQETLLGRVYEAETVSPLISGLKPRASLPDVSRSADDENPFPVLGERNFSRETIQRLIVSIKKK